MARRSERLEELEPNGHGIVHLSTGTSYFLLASEYDSIRAQIRLAEAEEKVLWWSGFDRYGDPVEIRTDYIISVSLETPRGVARNEELEEEEETAWED